MHAHACAVSRHPDKQHRTFHSLDQKKNLLSRGNTTTQDQECLFVKFEDLTFVVKTYYRIATQFVSLRRGSGS